MAEKLKPAAELGVGRGNEQSRGPGWVVRQSACLNNWELWATRNGERTRQLALLCQGRVYVPPSAGAVPAPALAALLAAAGLR